MNNENEIDLTIEELDNIEETLKVELAKVRRQKKWIRNKLQDGKKMFILSEEQIHYLEWASIQYKKSQSDIVRDIIQDRINSDNLWKPKKKTIKNS